MRVPVINMFGCICLKITQNKKLETMFNQRYVHSIYTIWIEEFNDASLSCSGTGRDSRTIPFINIGDPLFLGCTIYKAHKM